ncbi:hypothetical protein [Frigoriglobus tundricola]|uniref:Uncharacterized protein n=1 Tax=Frigoriglobus tundricola TaxID=2774151 RepID=A0A6M5YGV5_9BACT|nr:hypothetical protein [Frigoriglobus tundricola]QJW93267.1 hypothetical protein FTUN_0772 [Frigoriglobus tundricola]
MSQYDPDYPNSAANPFYHIVVGGGSGGGGSGILEATGVNAEQAPVGNLQVSQVITDLVGKLITLPYCNPEAMVSGTGSATNTANTSVIAAQGSGVRIYVTSIVITNTSATNTFVNILDGTTTKLVYPAAAGGGAVHTLAVPLRLSANSALQFSAGNSASTVYVSAIGYTGR